MNMISRDVVDARGEVAAPDFCPPRAGPRKWPLRYGSIETAAIGADVAIIIAASVLSDLSCRPGDAWAIADACRAAGAAIVVAALFVLLFKTQGHYAPPKLLDTRRQCGAVCLYWAAAFALSSLAIAMLGFRPELPKGLGAPFAAVGVIMLIAQRLVGKALLAKGLMEHRFAGGKVLLISDQMRSSGSGLRAQLVAVGYQIAHQLNLPRAGASASYRRHFCSLVVKYARDTDIEEIIVEATPERWCEMIQLAGGLKVLPIPVILVSSAAAADLSTRPLRTLGGALGIELQSRPLTRGGRLAKRCLDVAGAAFALAVLSPLMIAVAAIIKMDSHGPVLFRQRRCGFNGRCFTIYKFRTMTVLEDGRSIIQATSSDRRVTAAGHWLRQTSIDELPQLWNVLRGDMSLVGPRPHAMAHDDDFDQAVHQYAGRRRVKPGLTGWAQIHGCRGPTPTMAYIEQRVGYDLWYIDNWSFLLDIAILLRTPMEVLRGRNAF